jgi:hypothetical protein
MAVETDLGVFAVGFGGGVANEILHWWGLRENPNLPDYARHPLYWVITLAMTCLGGVLAWLQLGSPADGLIAFQVGLAAPMVLEKLIKAVPDRAGGMGVGGPSLRDFLKG